MYSGSGAHGYLLKDAGKKEICEAIQTVFNGERVCKPFGGGSVKKNR